MEWIHTRWRKTENAELTEESHLEGSPILKEVTDAIKNMKTGKIAGPDITAEELHVLETSNRNINYSIIPFIGVSGWEFLDSFLLLM